MQPHAFVAHARGVDVAQTALTGQTARRNLHEQAAHRQTASAVAQGLLLLLKLLCILCAIFFGNIKHRQETTTWIAG
jgi:hypothetical protein